jgi:hypothetical protein
MGRLKSVKNTRPMIRAASKRPNQRKLADNAGAYADDYVGQGGPRTPPKVTLVHLPILDEPLPDIK